SGVPMSLTKVLSGGIVAYAFVMLAWLIDNPPHNILHTPCVILDFAPQRMGVEDRGGIPLTDVKVGGWAKVRLGNGREYRTELLSPNGSGCVAGGQGSAAVMVGRFTAHVYEVNWVDCK